MGCVGSLSCAWDTRGTKIPGGGSCPWRKPSCLALVVEGAHLRCAMGGLRDDRAPLLFARAQDLLWGRKFCDKASGDDDVRHLTTATAV